MHRLLVVVLAVILLAAFRAAAQPEVNSLTAQERSDGWSLLFDGRSLDGWTTSGNPACWGVDAGQIVIRPDAPGGGGWWLRTTRQYRDFELMLDFMPAAGANSGIGLRGSTVGDPAFTGLEVQILDTAGQEPSVTNCGAVYDAIAPTAMAVNKPGEWNTYRIRLVGDTLDVWLNGTQIHTAQKLDDRGYVHEVDRKSPLADRLPKGYISLQCHGDVVKFRNIKVLDLSPDPDPPTASDFVPVFNGKDLTGWAPRGAANWTVEEGTLVGSDGPGHLFSDAVYSDLEVRAFVRANTKGNSGLYFRTVPRPEDPDNWPLGYEAQVDNHDPKNFTGCVYDRAWAKQQITRDNAWFDYRVRAVGNRVQTWVNGVPMVDATLADFAQGRLALQSHHKGNRIEWRDIQVRDLSARKDGAANPSGKIRVFYCTHSAGFKHEVLPETRTIMTRLGSALPWLEVTVSDDIRDLAAERLAKTDVVMFYTTGALPMGRMRGALLEWILDGGGLVGVHSATDTLSDDPEYVRTIGGIFDGHPWNTEVTLIAETPNDPIVAPFLAGSAGNGPVLSRRFTVADEIYQFSSLTDDRRVLIKLDPSTPGAVKGREYPIAWTREQGRGRVFYTALGHRPEAWRDERFIQHVLEGIRWAAHRTPISASAGPDAKPGTR